MSTALYRAAAHRPGTDGPAGPRAPPLPLDRRGHHRRGVRARVPRGRGADDRLRHRGPLEVHLLLRPAVGRGRRLARQGRGCVRRPDRGLGRRLRAAHRDDRAGRAADLRGPRRRARLPRGAVQHRRPGPGDHRLDLRGVRRVQLAPAAGPPPARRGGVRAARRRDLGRARRVAQGRGRGARGDRDDHAQLRRRGSARLPPHDLGLPAARPHRPHLADRGLRRDLPPARRGSAAPGVRAWRSSPRCSSGGSWSARRPASRSARSGPTRTPPRRPA